MRDYLKAHGARAVFPANWAAAVAVLVIGADKLPVPQLWSGFTSGVNAALFLSSVAGIGASRAGEGMALSLEARPERRLIFYDATLIAGLIAPFFLAALAAISWSRSDVALLVFRDGVFFTGLGLLGASVKGPAFGSGLTVMYCVAASVFGGRPDGGSASWAFVRSDGSWDTAVAASVILMLAAGVFTTQARSRVRTLAPE
jgi:hypothetical protein